MPPTGSAFTDWQQVDAEERRLLMDEDFSWSEPPARSRRRPVEEPQPSRRRTAVIERERDDARDSREDDARAQVSETHSEFDALMQRWNDAYGDGARDATPAQRRVAGSSEADPYASDPYETELYDPDPHVAAGFDYDDLARYTEGPVVEDRSGAYVDESGRRTVVITGRGAERYTPSSRRRQAAELRFHERSGFNPDRTAMWAVLLGLALLLGAIVH
jgi:hypothetical protein